VVEYWENFASHAFESTTQSVVSHCVLLKPSGAPVPCTFCFSIRRDIMDLPSIIIGEYFSNLAGFSLISVHCRPMVAVIVALTGCLKLSLLLSPRPSKQPLPHQTDAPAARFRHRTPDPNFPTIIRPCPLYYTRNDGSSNHTDINSCVQNSRNNFYRA
jgi:hypothetical protein